MYASGWVEQGGLGPLVAPNAQATINFPIAMIDTNYTILFGESNAGAKIVAAITRTNNSVTVESYDVTGTANVLVSWCVCGKANMTGHEILPSLYPKHEEEAWEHRVISFQKPTSENSYTWFRLYADGWVEQGGITNAISVAGNSGTNVDVTLPITMADTNYNILTTRKDGGSGFAQTETSTNILSTSVMCIVLWNNASSAAAGGKFWWQVSGMAA